MSEVVFILNWRNVSTCAAWTRYCKLFKGVYLGVKWDTWVGVKWHESYADMYTYMSFTDMQTCLMLCLFWTEEMVPGLGIAIVSRQLPGGQVEHMVWGQVGSSGTHVPSDMQMCLCRSADISNAYICPVLICRYGWIFVDSKMPFMPFTLYGVPPDPGQGQVGHLFWKFPNEIFNSIFHFAMLVLGQDKRSANSCNLHDCAWHSHGNMCSLRRQPLVWSLSLVNLNLV